MKKNKYYVVWQGRKTGIFESWEDCKKQIDGFQQAVYKSFKTLNEAQLAYQNNYQQYFGNIQTKPALSNAEKAKYGQPILPSISVDAACSGNPGVLEYRGVDTETKQEIFIQGPFQSGTNNIGEFLALVHALALLKKKGSDLPIYSDSEIAISWVKAKKIRTKHTRNKKNENLFDLMERAEKWLTENTYTNKILKWETVAWGENPADFGRK